MPLEREARTTDGRSLLVHLTAYLQSNGEDVGGVVILFVDVTDIKRAELALRESEQRLESELEILRQLHRLTVEVAKVPTVKDALQYLLANAMELHGADFGTVHLVDDPGRTLRIVAQQGFAPMLPGVLESIDGQSESACGMALRTRRTCQIGEVNADSHDARQRAAAAEAGYRSAQSTPLMDPRGEIIGVLSIYFKQPHTFTLCDNQLADVLGHQAASLIALRLQQEQLATLNTTLLKRTAELERSRDQKDEQATKRRDLEWNDR